MDRTHILTVNAGSSSIKLVLFEASESPRQILEAVIKKIGQAEASFDTKGPNGEGSSQAVTAPDHAAASQLLMSWIGEQIRPEQLSAIGHRVVHGGPKYGESQLVTAEVIDELRNLTPFDPEHLPIEIQLIEMFQQSFPATQQVACFDTAFHHELPHIAKLLPIPRRYEALGVRRYGFHGLSYTYLMGEIRRLAGPEAANGRIILAHLGNGASLAAVHDGKSIDTSMALTPAAGLPMSTRSGDLDPGLGLYLAKLEGLDADQFNNMINFQSGLLGISETTSDMEELLAHEAEDERAADAVALFCYQTKKWLGSYAAALGGLDTLVFAGGMGENAPKIRARVCAGLEFLGIDIDEARNAANADIISSETSRVTVRVIHTDEAQTIATDIKRLLSQNNKESEDNNGAD